MNNLLRDMPLFAEVAKHKSFSRAAESLDMYISTLSRRIAQMEEDLGVPLFLRSTRHVELTDSGRMLYDRCRFVMAETENIYEEVVQNMTRPAGPLRVAVPADVYHTYMWGIMSRFAASWPDIRMHVHFAQRWVDLLTEPFDLDIRVGSLPDSELRARKLIAMVPRLFASPLLLEKYPALKTPSDLRHVPCITLAQVGEVWTLHKGKTTETVSINAAHMVNSTSLSIELAIAGLGVIWLVPAMGNHPAVNAGDLVQVLPGWTAPGIDLHVVMAKNQLPHRVRLFVDCLAEHFAQFQ